MKHVAELLRSIEQRAEGAIVQQLRLMREELLSIRTLLVLEERAHADALLLKLDHLEQGQLARPSLPGQTHEYLAPDLQIQMLATPHPAAYEVRLYNAEYGDLENVFTVECFSAGVQLLHEKLTPASDYAITASWKNYRGELTVSNLAGNVLAMVMPTEPPAPTVQPLVSAACVALEQGDASAMEQLFVVQAEAA